MRAALHGSQRRGPSASYAAVTPWPAGHTRSPLAWLPLAAAVPWLRACFGRRTQRRNTIQGLHTRRWLPAQEQQSPQPGAGLPACCVSTGRVPTARHAAAGNSDPAPRWPSADAGLQGMAYFPHRCELLPRPRPFRTAAKGSLSKRRNTDAARSHGLAAAAAVAPVAWGNVRQSWPEEHATRPAARHTEQNRVRGDRCRAVRTYRMRTSPGGRQRCAVLLSASSSSRSPRRHRIAQSPPCTATETQRSSAICPQWLLWLHGRRRPP